ncbi:MAG: methyltransferase domain-containing protein [Phycisphaerales bacterium]|nr:methyltransferase domain-containing protein [Phycisphaerales bacterium]
MNATTLEDATQRVWQEFPFEGYISPARREAVYPVISSTVRRLLPNGGRILDVGAGGCDTATVLSLMGYDTAAFDDFQDTWHLRNDNWEHIIRFASERGVDARRITDHTVPLPWEAESFDIVMAHDVIEHLHDSPKGMLEACWKLIKPGGYLFLTAPNAGNVRKRAGVLLGQSNMADFGYFYWCGTPWRGHVREYVRSDFERMGRYLGLAPVELRDVDTIMARRFKQPAKAVYATLTTLFSGLRSSWLYVGRKTPGSHPMTDPPKEPRIESWLKAMSRDPKPGVAAGTDDQTREALHA